jgi:hypothetical protein
MNLAEAAEEHLNIAQRCFREADHEKTTPFLLASCMAVLDRSWTALRVRADAKRGFPRISTVRLDDHIWLASTCYQYMLAATQSEFSGDLITARAWISAIVITEQNGRRRADTRLGHDAFCSDLLSIATNMQGNTEAPTKNLRDAIAMARRLSWRCKAFHLASCGNIERAECAATCAKLVVKCLDRLLRTEDPAVITLLERAVQTAEPLLQELYLVAGAELPPSLRSELVQLWKRATEIPVYRNSLVEGQHELEKLDGQRDSYLSPKLVKLHDELVAALQAKMAHRAAYLTQLEEGDPFPIDNSNEFENAVRFCRGKLTVARPVIEQLQRVSRKVSELKKRDADKLTLFELRCWVGVGECVTTALDGLLNTTYDESTRDTSFSDLKCTDAELRIRVVESLIGAAQQYQSEIRAEWRPEVKHLLSKAVQWTCTCAAKTLESIEARAHQNSTWDIEGKWRSHCHGHSDHCAQLYARAAAELRMSCNLARSTSAVDQLKGSLYRISSDASKRQAEAASRLSGLSAEEGERLENCMREINTRSMSVAGEFADGCGLKVVELYCEWAQKVVADGADAEFAMDVVRQVHGIVKTEGNAPVEFAALTSYLLCRTRAQPVGQGANETAGCNLRVVLDQFECGTVYGVDFNRSSYGYVRNYTGVDQHNIRTPVNVVGAVVGRRLANEICPEQVLFGAEDDPLLSSAYQARLQPHLDKTLSLVKQHLGLNRTPELSDFPAELKDTRTSLVSAIRCAYEAMYKKLQRETVDDAAVANSCSCGEYKARVLHVLPGLVPAVVERAWKVFPAVGTVDPDECDVVIDALRTQSLDRLDAVISLREAEAAVKLYKEGPEHRQLGAEAKIVCRKMEVLNFGLKLAKLHLAALQALRLGDVEAARRFEVTQQLLRDALVIAQEVANMPKEAKTTPQEAQIKRLKSLADAAEHGDATTPEPAAANRKKGKGGKK